jgi:hypothetical protein
VQPWIDRVYVNGNLTKVNAVQELFKELNMSYDDPTRAQTAITDLRNLKQGNRSFANYLTQFEKLLMDAGATSWSDDAKKPWLTNGLNHEMISARLSAREPASYVDYVNDLHNTAANIEAARKPRKNQDQGKRSHRKPYGDNEEKDEMDWESTPSRASAARTKGRNSKKSSGQKAKWVSKEVLEARRENNECFRCSKSGHIVSECNLEPAVRPTVNKVRTSTSKLTITDEHSESETSDSSSDGETGKE